MRVIQIKKQSIAVFQVQKTVQIGNSAHAVSAVGNIRDPGLSLALFFEKIHVVMRTCHDLGFVRAGSFDVIHRVMCQAVEHHYRRAVFSEHAACQQWQHSSTRRTA
ncbi:hypothetical protein D3C84_933280 [compost metagenome]